MLNILLLFLLTACGAREITYEFTDRTDNCMSALVNDAPSAPTICEEEMCHLTFRRLSDPDPCRTNDRSLELRKYYHNHKRRSEEEKELPQLSMIEEPPNSRDVMTGGSTTLTCLAESQKTENIGYSWEFANFNNIIQSMPGNVGTQDNVLMISNMTGSNTGWYQCSASDGSNRALSRKTKINEIYFDDTFLEEPSDVTVPGGTLLITLTCVPPNSYPDAVVTWYRNGDEVADSNALQTPTGSLVIHHLTTANTGTYYCQAENELLDGANAASSTAELTVTDAAIETDNHLPTAIWSDYSMYFVAGDTVTITCGVYGEETPDIVWYKGTQERITDNLMSFSRMTISQDKYELRIQDLEISDTGFYICIAENSLDTDGLPISTALWVVSDLRFTVSLTDKSLVKEDTFTLVCEVTGNPVSSIAWYADGQKLVKQNNHVDWYFDIERGDGGEFATRGVLTVTNSNVEDTGLYQCFAVNDHQTAMNSASVFISSILSFEEVHFISPDKMYVEDGQEGEVTCGGQGSPIPSVSWVGLSNQYADIVEITEGTVGLSSTQHVSFPIGPLYLNESDQHTFTCLASQTHAGVDYSKIRDVSVVVGYPVEWVNGTWPVVEVDKGSSTVLNCQFSGIPTPVVTWKRNGVDLPIVDADGNSNHVVQNSGALLIVSATSSDNTMFTCVGTNGFNEVDQAIQLIVADTVIMSIVAKSGLAVGILLFLCLLILVMIILYRHNRREKKVDVAIMTANGNGVDPVYAHQKALEKLKQEEEARRLKEELRREEEERLKAEAEKKRLQKEEKQRQLDEQRRIEEEEAAKILEEQRLRKEEEECQRIEKERLTEEERKRLEEERLKKEAEEEAERQKLERDALQQKEAQELAMLEAERLRLAEEEKKRLEEEQLKKEAEEKARLEAEEKARLEAEEKARLEEEAERIRKENEEKARLEAEEKARLEEEAEWKRLEEEERLRLEAEEKARLEAEEEAKLLEEEERIKKEEEEKARLEAEEAERKRLEEEERLRKEAEEKERLEAEEKARLEAEEKARLEAEEKARLEAEEKRLEEERLQNEAEELARLEGEERIKREQEILAAEQLKQEKLRKEAEEKALFEAQELERKRHEEEERLRLQREAEEQERLRLEEEERLRKEEEERLKQEEEERLKREEEERIAREAEAARKLAEEEERLRLEEEERIRQEEERIAILQLKEEEGRRKREEEERLAQEMFEQQEDAERKAREKEAAREEAQRQLEEDTALAAAKEEAATRKQKDMHDRNMELAEKEFQAAKTAEIEAENSVKESKSDRELEIANRMRDGALVRAQRATINKDLAVATITRDPKKLKPIITKAEQKRVSGTENYLLQAKRLYEQLQAATHLKGATFDRRIADIEAAIHAIKKGGFETLLAVELLEAQVLLKKLQRIQKAALEVQKLSQQTIAIMKSYNRPPDVVTQVMRSVFLLLGNKSQELSTWPDIVIQLNKIGKDNTKRRIQCCCPEDIDFTAAKKVELILCKYDEELVFDTTQALGVFYNWAECIADERLALPEILTEKHKSSGLFGAARPPPLPDTNSLVSSGTPPRKKRSKPPSTASSAEDKRKTGSKGKRKLKAAVIAGGLKIGADKSMPPPPKFLYNET